MVQYSCTSTETRRLVRTDSPGRPPRLSHSFWTICCKMFPAAFNRDVTGAQRVLEGVFVALCLSTLPCECREPVRFRAEDLFWKTAVLHSHLVASPCELGLHDQDINTWHAGTVKYLLVGDSVLPGNAQEPADGSGGGTGPASWGVCGSMSRSRNHTARMGGLQLCRQQAFTHKKLQNKKVTPKR